MLAELKDVIDKKRPTINADSIEDVMAGFAELLFDLADPHIEEEINKHNN